MLKPESAIIKENARKQYTLLEFTLNVIALYKLTYYGI